MLAHALQAERTYTLGNVYSLFHADTENLLLLIVANTSIYAGGEALGAARRTNELDIRTTSTAACSAGAWSTCLESVRARFLCSLPQPESVILSRCTMHMIPCGITASWTSAPPAAQLADPGAPATDRCMCAKSQFDTALRLHQFVLPAPLLSPFLLTRKWQRPRPIIGA